MIIKSCTAGNANEKCLWTIISKAKTEGKKKKEKYFS